MANEAAGRPGTHIHSRILYERAPNNGATRPPAEIRLRQSKSQSQRDVHMNRNYNYVLYTEKETASAFPLYFGPRSLVIRLNSL